MAARLAGLNVASTSSFALIVTTQLLFNPLHASPQPRKFEPAVGVSVRVTWVPAAKFALQLVGQLIPEGLLVTVPEPVPSRVTASRGRVGLNVAVTDWFALISTMQVLDVPLHAPPHPAKDEVDPGVAVSVTLVPRGKLAVQVCGQLIPPESLLTVPVPVPERLTLNMGRRLKVAVTCSLALTVTTQVELLPQPAPVQPAKYEFAAAVAVRVT